MLYVQHVGREVIHVIERRLTVGAHAPQRLVSTAWLEARLSTPEVHPVEVRFSADTQDGSPGLIPGSVAVHWKRLLWDDYRREFATAETLSSRLFELGVGQGTIPVFYGEEPQFGAYALWVLQARGLSENARYLDGGLEAWHGLGLPLGTAVDVPARLAADVPLSIPGADEINPFSTVAIGREELRESLHDAQSLLIDMRSTEEFSGERVTPWSMGFDHGAERAGHIPGAVHLHIRDLLDDLGRVRPQEELQATFAQVGLDSARQAITYCRLSHRASLGWLILTDVLNTQGVRVYDGSWTEWGSVVGLPIER
ncbi:sulfurtransferase [Rhodococcus jostii]|uniref:sulfurtransferase n=1 Tax=Rhodococcus jostii TaxID=132919 RepID=UPI0009F5A8DC|nr:rhodanese-like domain-containing protein [Rhodococcus jostii]